MKRKIYLFTRWQYYFDSTNLLRTTIKLDQVTPELINEIVEYVGTKRLCIVIILLPVFQFVPSKFSTVFLSRSRKSMRPFGKGLKTTGRSTIHYTNV